MLCLPQPFANCYILLFPSPRGRKVSYRWRNGGRLGGAARSAWTCLSVSACLRLWLTNCKQCEAHNSSLCFHCGRATMKQLFCSGHTQTHALIDWLNFCSVSTVVPSDPQLVQCGAETGPGWGDDGMQGEQLQEGDVGETKCREIKERWRAQNIYCCLIRGRKKISNTIIISDDFHHIENLHLFF